jgi:hypothetical protein
MRMKIIVISALVIIVLISTIAPNVMASKGYWTASSSYSPRGMTKYHLFLVGTYQSAADPSGMGAKLVNPNLTACLDFNPNYTNPKPVVCHPIKESEIPLKNDSVIDAGFFVVSDKLNASAATVCVQISYRNMYSCGQNSVIDPYSQSIPKLFYDLSDGIYQEARAYDYCIHDHPEDDLLWCVRQVT